MSSYVNHTHLYNWSAQLCYFTTAVLNDCYSEVTAYTVLAYSYWTSFHDAYICLRHIHYRYRLQLPYKSHRTYLTNHMGSISHHITPLVINSLGGGHTHIQTFAADRSNSKKPGVRRLQPARSWFNNWQVKDWQMAFYLLTFPTLNSAHVRYTCTHLFDTGRAGHILLLILQSNQIWPVKLTRHIIYYQWRSHLVYKIIRL